MASMAELTELAELLRALSRPEAGSPRPAVQARRDEVFAPQRWPSGAALKRVWHRPTDSSTKACVQLQNAGLRCHTEYAHEMTHEKNDDSANIELCHLFFFSDGKKFA
jgi:hypothetical protein